MKCQAKNRRFFKKNRKKVKNRGQKGETPSPFRSFSPLRSLSGMTVQRPPGVFFGVQSAALSLPQTSVCGPRHLESRAPEKIPHQSAKRGRHRSRCRRVFFEGGDRCRVESRATFARRTPPQGLGAFTHHGLSGLSPVTHICGPYLHCATALYA